jgi:threonine dehydratase
LDELRQAHVRIGGSIHRTPVATSSLLDDSAGCHVVLKCENLQKTGSFKARGALNAVSSLGNAERRAGVVTVSAGNHAQALAWAARTCRTTCTVVMPASASRSKVDASRDYGATVLFEETATAAFERAQYLADHNGLCFVHPFDDPVIVAGAATAALELYEQVPAVSAIVVPVGGGGLIAGIALATAAVSPNTRVYGVEPAGAAAMHQSLEIGAPVRLEAAPRTIADGLAAPMAGKLNFEIVRRHAESVVLIDDDSISAATRLVITRTKMLVEPAGAAAVAAILAGAVPVERGATVCAILSGGNVDLERLC